MGLISLSMNPKKTTVKDACREHFDFLDYTFCSMRFTRNGRRYMGARLTKESIGRLKYKVLYVLRPCEKGTWPEVRDRINALLLGWCVYFSYGTIQPAYRAVERNVYDRCKEFSGQTAQGAFGRYPSVFVRENVWRAWCSLAKTDENGQPPCALK